MSESKEAPAMEESNSTVEVKPLASPELMATEGLTGDVSGDEVGSSVCYHVLMKHSLVTLALLLSMLAHSVY